ncbi:hypothetical protein [Aquirufa sp.]|jgi:hypothetical protein|uniref:hypothetical protein n=1 Tax=Aquirufa sp. TaxID=2676249 RepID=UPI0037841EE5
MRNLNSFFAIFLFLSLGFTKLYGQDSQWIPENHRIQYQNFQWNYISSSNFEVYYFDKNEALAKSTLTYLESDNGRITEILSYTPYQKVKIFVYPNHETWLQSNSGISLANSADVAEENLAKFRIEVAFKDNLVAFKQEITKQIVRVYLHDLLFGGSVRDVLQNSLLLNVSDWFVLGMSAYLASGDSPEMRRFTYQIISENKIRRLQVATGAEAELLGQSIWSYIANTYGKQAIGNILNLTRIIRSEQSSLSSTIRKPFSKFLKDWYEYLNDAKNLEIATSKVFPSSFYLPPSNQINSFQASPDGLFEAFVTDEFGRYKVYLHNVATDKLQLLQQTGLKDLNRTSDGKGPLISWSGNNRLSVLFNEQGFTWMKNYQVNKGGNYTSEPKLKIANLSYLDMKVSSNGMKALVRVLEKGQVDLGIYDLKRNKLNLLTKDAYNETEAHWMPDNRVIYITDRYIDSLPSPPAPISSLFVWNPDEPENPTRLFSTSGKVYNFKLQSDSVAYFLHNQANGPRLIRFQMADTSFRQSRVRTVAWQNFELTAKGVYALERNIVTDNIQRYTETSLEEYLGSEWIPKINSANPTTIIEQEVASFETDAAKKARKARLDRQLSIRLKREPGKMVGPLAYQNSFVFNSSEGQFKSDPIRGIGYAYELKANDLLENHLFKAGAFLTANLLNSDIWGEYAYLANKLDWKFRYDRKVLGQDTENDSQKIRFNRFALTASYPFSLLSRLSVTGLYSTNRLFNQVSLVTPEEYSGFAGALISYEVDNTVQAGDNLRTGYRINATLEAQKDMVMSGEFVRIGFDARYYKKLSNTFYFATRFSSSHQLGSRTQASMLGGMDNWFFNRRDVRAQETPLGLDGLARRDVFMSNFIAPLRGFALNKLSGNSHLLFNAEIRIPVKSIMPSESSSLLNSVQLVGFTDVGTAWTGSSPFEKSNGFNTNVYGGKTNPFIATVTDFRNPFLVGYGIGARAVIFGYFVKFDYAFGIENKEVKSPLTYLTLGYDF